MNITQIQPDYSVSSQIAIDEVRDIAELGFKSIMCNRPDGESPDQPAVEDIRAEAERQGLAFAFIPVTSGNILDENVTDVKNALETLPGPVLAYCRSGARCQGLYILAQN